MIEIVDPNDVRAVRNKNSIVQFYELMYEQRRPAQAVAMSLDPAYIQHNPVVPDSAAGLEKFLGDAMVAVVAVAAVITGLCFLLQ